MKVGIIGGGLAGLTCAYRLSQNNINSIIFEQEPEIGGRILYNIGAVSQNSLHLETQSLIKELGLDILYTPLPPDASGLLCGKRLIKAKDLFKGLKWLFFKKAIKNHEEIMGKVLNLDFNLFNPSQELIKLRSISLADYFKDCPLMIKRFCIDPHLNFVQEYDYNKIAADYGLHILRHGFEVISGKDYIFEENLLPLINYLKEKVSEAGVLLNNPATVTKVSKANQGFKINYNEDNQKKTGIVDKVVLATTPAMAQSLMKELKIKCDIYYKKMHCVLTKGELIHDCDILVGVKDKDKSNIAIFSTSLPYEHLAIALDPDKEIDFNTVYKKNKYEISSEKIIDGAVPVRPPNARVPELETNARGVYLCGDFYYYGLLETSVATANMVAKMIKKSVKK